MPAPISAQQRPIGQFFGGEYVFKIPGYQRPYAWTTDQASELFEDLKGALEDGGKGKAIADLGPYFLGSIVKSIPDAAQRALRVHQIGNLALLTRRKNSAASNWDFERKKKTYFGGRGGVSPFALTTQVISKDKWGVAEIDARQAELLSLFEKHWRLENRQDELDALLNDDA